MEPACRIAFNYPIYALDLLPDDQIAVAGGGGLMKSGIPNRCAILSFNPDSDEFSSESSIDLPDTAVALVTSDQAIHTVIGTGLKSFSSAGKKINPFSSFKHDLRVSSTQSQSAVAISADGKTIVIASDEGHVVALRLPRYEQLCSTRLHSQGINDICMSHDGTLVATTARDRTAYIWRSATGDVLHTITPALPSAIATHVRAIRFCESRPELIVVAESNARKGGWVSVRKMSPEGKTLQYHPVATIKASEDAITALAVNSTGSLLAISSAEGHVSLLGWDGSALTVVWNTETRKNWFSPPKPPHVLPVTDMRFSQSGEHLFTSSADYTVAAWPTRLPLGHRRFASVLLMLITLIVAIFAMMAAEDQHLHSSLRRSRIHLQPYMEPYLSRFQDSVRPVLRKYSPEQYLYLSRVRTPLESLNDAESQSRPRSSKRGRHSPLSPQADKTKSTQCSEPHLQSETTRMKTLASRIREKSSEKDPKSFPSSRYARRGSASSKASRTGKPTFHNERGFSTTERSLHIPRIDSEGEPEIKPSVHAHTEVSSELEQSHTVDSSPERRKQSEPRDVFPDSVAGEADSLGEDGAMNTVRPRSLPPPMDGDVNDASETNLTENDVPTRATGEDLEENAGEGSELRNIFDASRKKKSESLSIWAEALHSHVNEELSGIMSESIRQLSSGHGLEDISSSPAESRDSKEEGQRKLHDINLATEEHNQGRGEADAMGIEENYGSVNCGANVAYAASRNEARAKEGIPVAQVPSSICDGTCEIDEIPSSLLGMANRDSQDTRIRMREPDTTTLPTREEFTAASPEQSIGDTHRNRAEFDDFRATITIETRILHGLKILLETPNTSNGDDESDVSQGIKSHELEARAAAQRPPLKMQRNSQNHGPGLSLVASLRPPNQYMCLQRRGKHIVQQRCIRNQGFEDGD